MHTLRRVIHRRDLVAAPSTATVMEVASLMTDEHVGALCILDGDRLVGIFSERDLMTRVVVAGRDARKTIVSDVMTRDVVTASIDDSRSECIAKMREERFRHLPVLDGDLVTAMLSMRDLLRDEIEEQREELVVLQAYLHSNPV
ncbi:MAG: CBS domain-containing protein [Deltaproteobacteria bacterium]|nr:CBS domain-containing protein [Deltaproteobacteria bacterium]